MKYRTLNGWTKESMIKHIENEMKDWPSEKDGTCVYRAEDGNKCLVGCFIPDELYEPEFDQLLDFAGIDLFDQRPELIYKMPLETNAMVILQELHDTTSMNPKPILKKWINENVENSQ